MGDMTFEDYILSTSHNCINWEYITSKVSYKFIREHPEFPWVNNCENYKIAVSLPEDSLSCICDVHRWYKPLCKFCLFHLRQINVKK